MPARPGETPSSPAAVCSARRAPSPGAGGPATLGLVLRGPPGPPRTPPTPARKGRPHFLTAAALCPLPATWGGAGRSTQSSQGRPGGAGGSSRGGGGDGQGRSRGRGVEPRSPRPGPHGDSLARVCLGLQGWLRAQTGLAADRALHGLTRMVAEGSAGSACGRAAAAALSPRCAPGRPLSPQRLPYIGALQEKPDSSSSWLRSGLIG